MFDCYLPCSHLDLAQSPTTPSLSCNEIKSQYDSLDYSDCQNSCHCRPWRCRCLRIPAYQCPLPLLHARLLTSHPGTLRQVLSVMPRPCSPKSHSKQPRSSDWELPWAQSSDPSLPRRFRCVYVMQLEHRRGQYCQRSELDEARKTGRVGRSWEDRFRGHILMPAGIPCGTVDFELDAPEMHNLSQDFNVSAQN